MNIMKKGTEESTFGETDALITNKQRKFMNAKNLASTLKNLLLTMTHKLNIHRVQKEYAI